MKCCSTLESKIKPIKIVKLNCCNFYLATVNIQEIFKAHYPKSKYILKDYSGMKKVF
jgi:hypothetical protein